MKKIFLILIIVLAFFLRFYKLGTYPAFNADEASNGYDAYSLIQTGMDQHGHSWPITFQSFNDYKPGLYVYLAIPFVKILGLTEFAVRIPGALAGVLTVFVLYLLVRELEIGKLRDHGSWKLEIIASFLLSISPWHIQFSRGGWEVNVATLFILLGVYLFVLFLRSRKFWHLAFSIFNLALSLYTYHAARVIVPILGIAAILIYKKELFVKENIKNIVVGIIFGIIILFPLAHDLMAPGALSRAAGVGLFADPGPINRINEQRGEHGSSDSIVSKLLHNKFVNYGLTFSNNYLSHFNGEFLFMSGDSIERNKVPETGEMYLFDMLFLAAGFVFIAHTYSLFAKPYSLILSWLFIAPIASALTFQSPNALRSQIMVIPLVIISAFGFYQLVKKYKIRAFLILGILVSWNFCRYLNMYYLHMSQIYPYSSQYGVKELVTYVSQNQTNYKDIYITNRYDQPYILFLFYSKYPPQKFQFHHVLTTRDEFGFSTVADFDKYHFRQIDFNSMKNNYPNSLIIGTTSEIPQSANIVKRIYGTNGFEYFDVVQN